MNTETLILSGEGYALTITPEAEIQKAKLLEIARAVQHVRSNDESADAAYGMRQLAAMRIAVDKSRKEIKEPVIRIGKLIENTAKNFLAELEDEESRIRGLIGDYANEVARLAAIKMEEERIAFDAAQAAEDAADAAADAAAATGRMSDIVAAKQAEMTRLGAIAARMDASSNVAATKVADGVRFAWDFEVVSLDMLYLRDRSLVEITPRRAAILALIKGCDESGRDAADVFSQLGIRAFKKPVVSSK